MAKTDFQHNMPLRVRWAEVDAQNIVFNGHYLLYTDICINEYWRALGMRYPDEVVKAFGIDLFVVKSTLEYHASARFDDQLEVCGRIGRIGHSSLQFIIEMHRGDEHLITGEVIYVCADVDTRKSVPVPQLMRERIAAYERLKPAV